MNNLLTLTPAEFCAATDACAEGRDWAITQPTMADVWDNCPRGDWLAWIAQKIKATDDDTFRLFAIWCAESTPLHDGRVTSALMADLDSACYWTIRCAYSAAYDQPRADRAAWDAANYAADAARYVAAWSYRPSPAAVAAAALMAARLAQANHFRHMVKNPFPRTQGGAT